MGIFTSQGYWSYLSLHTDVLVVLTVGVTKSITFSYTFGKITYNACFHPVDEQMRSSPVKVIRHVNGPSAWILSQADSLPHNVKPPDPVKTVGEPSVDNTASGMISKRTEESNLAVKQVTENAVRHLEDEALVTEFYERTKVLRKSLALVWWLCPN